MTVVIGSILIFIAWLIACIVVTVGGVYLAATWGKPKKRPQPAPPVTPAPSVLVNDATRGRFSPTYLRRWGHFRRAEVAAEKAAWDEDFNRLSEASARYAAGAVPPPADRT